MLGLPNLEAGEGAGDGVGSTWLMRGRGDEQQQMKQNKQTKFTFRIVIAAAKAAASIDRRKCELGNFNLSFRERMKTSLIYSSE